MHFFYSHDLIGKTSFPNPFNLKEWLVPGHSNNMSCISLFICFIHICQGFPQFQSQGIRFLVEVATKLTEYSVLLDAMFQPSLLLVPFRRKTSTLTCSFVMSRDETNTRQHAGSSLADKSVTVASECLWAMRRADVLG